MKNLNIIKSLLVVLSTLAFMPAMAQQGTISEDMLNMLRKQGYNIDGPTPPMDATSYNDIEVTINAAATKGKLLHTELYNNFSHSEAFVEQRRQDVAFYNKIGLHGKVYRVWLEQDRFYDPATGKVDFHEMPPYLEDASTVSDYLLVNCGHLGVKNSWKLPFEESVDRLAIILGELKKQFPKVRYIEATNEPDYSQEGFTPDNYYDVYKVFYKAVNKINAEQKPEIPLEVGGPSTAQFSLEWLQGFLDDYVADPDADKHIDFISYHGYFTKPGQEYIMFRNDPSLVMNQRSLLEAELSKRGLNTDIPAFVTEMGLYPGPSFDDFKTMKFDRLRQAAGMASIFYWYMESENIYPFNWVLRHQTEGRKDQLVSRDEIGGPFVHTEKLTPYGNFMLMMSKMKTDRLQINSTLPIADGKGLYSLAAKDKTGISALIWNYQATKTEGYQTEINFDNLPKGLKNKKVTLKTYLIDQHTSNYQNGIENCNLQLIDEKTIKVKATHKESLKLEPNSMALIVMERAK